MHKNKLSEFHTEPYSVVPKKAFILSEQESTNQARTLGLQNIRVVRQIQKKQSVHSNHSWCRECQHRSDLMVTQTVNKTNWEDEVSTFQRQLFFHHERFQNLEVLQALAKARIAYFVSFCTSDSECFSNSFIKILIGWLSLTKRCFTARATSIPPCQ